MNVLSEVKTAVYTSIFANYCTQQFFPSDTIIALGVLQNWNEADYMLFAIYLMEKSYT